jgi:hypothetical protein
MALVLSAFPSLTNTRVVVLDNPDLLGGWLNETQVTFVKEQAISPRFRSKGCDFYISDEDIPHYVMAALAQANLTIKDLRFSTNVPFRTVNKFDLPLSLLPPSLHTLRMSINRRYWKPHSEHAGAFSSFLAKSKCLEDVALTCERYRSRPYRYTRRMAQEFMFGSIALGLSGASKLRLFAIEGRWG